MAPQLNSFSKDSTKIKEGYSEFYFISTDASTSVEHDFIGAAFDTDADDCEFQFILVIQRLYSLF